MRGNGKAKKELLTIMNNKNAQNDLFFKYRDISNLRYFLDILLYNRLYAAKYNELNDPMEGN